MSQENVEVVKVANEAFVREGLDRFMEHFTDDVVYRAVEGAPADSGPIHGKDAVRAWLQDWIDMLDEFWFEQVELIDAGGDTVVSVERFGGRAKHQNRSDGSARLLDSRRKACALPRVRDPSRSPRSRRA
jgi:ketosteroid isomerase-like protein